MFAIKSYDNEKYEKAKKDGNTEKMKAYSVESKSVNQRMQDLRKRVMQTADKTIGFHKSYKTPSEGVEYMFSQIWDYLIYSFGVEGAKLSPRELSLSYHDRYAELKSRSFIGRKDILKVLLQTNKNVVLTGEQGCGKSAVIATLRKMLDNYSIRNKIIITHYIACEKKMKIDEILERINLELLLAMQSKGYDIGENFIRKGSNISDHLKEFTAMLEQLNTRDEKCVLVIDGLNSVDKIEQNSKVCIFFFSQRYISTVYFCNQPLHWIPHNLIKSLQVILATTSSDRENIEELLKRDYEEIHVPLLDDISKLDLCLVI